MTTSAGVSVPIRHTDRFFIGGEWVTPSSDSTITVIDSHTEQPYLTVAEAQTLVWHGAVSMSRPAPVPARSTSAVETCREKTRARDVAL